MGWIEQNEVLKNIKMLILGDYGTGKSFFAASAPEPIYLIDFDRGSIGYSNKKVYIPDCLQDESLTPFIRWNNLERDIDLLIKQNHPAGEFRTIVLDSLTTASKYAMDIALEKRPVAPDAPPVWNVHYPMVKVYMDKILDKVKKLPTHLIVIGHVIYDKDNLTGEIVATPSITGNLKTYIPALFDEVYFSDFIQTKEGKKYVLNISPTGFKKARSRLRSVFNIPDQIPNQWSELEKYIKTNQKRRKEK